ncbi:twitching motility protein PilT [Capsulimonas corticalis]|uniref:Twitching motility protein PilT n=1 Tax=Capsulimonas corticalis TaxID=2219043 RepID=A0A402D2Z1_9BACT|nr:type II toxin-antitoxin system VapC family toxin [Capsulimonas corticalis]BDI28390.1 twitching motility protein PilT [Capsulimonas corticalis]
MRYLFDTCTLLWFANGESEKLSLAALSLINTSGNEAVVSVVSFWELAMKTSVGKLSFPGGSVSILSTLCVREGIQIQPLTVECIQQFLLLPPAHPDPFDRLLAAISILGNETTKPLVVLSPDTSFDAYAPWGVTRVW